MLGQQSTLRFVLERGERNEYNMKDKKVSNRKLMARVAVIAALTLAMAVIAGCGKETDKDNTPAEAS